MSHHHRAASVPPARQRRHSQPFAPPAHVTTPPPYAAVKADPYANVYVAPTLPSWAPYPQYAVQQYHAPQPAVPPQPQGYGYFQWPSTSTVDEIPDDHKGGRPKTPAPSMRSKKGGMFASLRRKVTGPDTHLHMLLLHARPSPLFYDVRNIPTTAVRAGGPGVGLPPAERAQHATSPPTTFLRITCELIPWSVEITRAKGITVGDVLDELYAMLHKRIRRSEWLIAQDGLQEKIVRAFAWRCYNSAAPRGYEEQQGPKRVDWLLKRTAFRGLSHGPDESTFVLHLGQH
ncbi:hypothetical protein EXIGLDRAFT_699701 [Exidia glandulosa HHB12029]|uniref:DUF6699 domain-containing protein n=1 Tax=Exidia glandulosa HHB12029 TaxID=1314781 RepID=A0A165DS22_EXIGL|nr:hypothetical protein EXIGLDRAFT_699701 [Exidia glandulosa HHB12029]